MNAEQVAPLEVIAEFSRMEYEIEARYRVVRKGGGLRTEVEVYGSPGTWRNAGMGTGAAWVAALTERLGAVERELSRLKPRARRLRDAAVRVLSSDTPSCPCNYPVAPCAGCVALDEMEHALVGLCGLLIDDSAASSPPASDELP